MYGLDCMPPSPPDKLEINDPISIPAEDSSRVSCDIWENRSLLPCKHMGKLLTSKIFIKSAIDQTNLKLRCDEGTDFSNL